MTELSGLVSLTPKGIDIDVFVGLVEEARQVPPLHFGDGHTLYAADVAQKPVTWEDRVGYASLITTPADGVYDGDYFLKPQWRGNDIIAVAMGQLIERVIEQDELFEAVDIVVDRRDRAALHVAEKLGATVTGHTDVGKLVLSVTEERFRASQVRRMGNGR